MDDVTSSLDGTILYFCDGNIHDCCDSTLCYRNGGECHYTAYADHRLTFVANGVNIPTTFAHYQDVDDQYLHAEQFDVPTLFKKLGNNNV